MSVSRFALALVLLSAAALPAWSADPAALWMQKHPSSAAGTAAQPGDDEQSDEDHQPIRPDQVHTAILWHDPGRIAGEDLFYGQGGRSGQPVPPFTFLEEVHRQSTPKFDARDAAGHKWRVKLGQEARPETVASRLLWAVGYFVQDDYVLPSADVTGIHMRRGRKYIDGERINDGRFYRKPSGQKRIASWRWKKNAFIGTREFNGLRVMMALINSWDLKDENNAVYFDKKSGRQLFLVSDTGSSFGRTGLHFNNGPSKDNVRAFANSKFITRRTATTVDFATPTPSWSLLAETLGFGMKQFLRRQGMLWIGREIPIQDAKWIGGLLAQLSHQQLVDAFRAGNYPPEVVEQFVTVIDARIHALNDL
jgi:hypothetical protein